MADFIYTTVPGKIKPLLGKIHEVGIPPKVTVQWLKTVGFTSSNDSSLIGVLKFIGLVDASNVPTPIWNQYRGTAHRGVLASAIQQGYAELFAVYPDANQRSTTELDHVFSTSSTGGKQVIAKTVATFKALSDEADFTSVASPSAMQMPSGPLHTPIAQEPSLQTPTHNSNGPSIHLDVQIHISPEASPDQIEQVFASMAKHLYGAKSQSNP